MGIERKQVATEWDMGWFCDKCDSLNHWKTKAYIVNDKHYCEKCAKEFERKEAKSGY